MDNSKNTTAAHTTNDLLFDLDPGHSRTALNYQIVGQSTEEVQDIQNAPAISMGQYLIESEQLKLLTTISIYTQPGESRNQVRLLYMNAIALQIWKAMGRQPTMLERLHRPPKTALLAFG